MLAWTLTWFGLDASVGDSSMTLLRLMLYLGSIELQAVTKVEATMLKSMSSSLPSSCLALMMFLAVVSR
eukprot:scaffold16987_cov73-Cyclotella_meneghiniana.AAC.4